MIKGINKHIIEINHTNSEYFDKIVLYVRSGKEVYSVKTLKGEAEDYVSKILPSKASKQTNMLIVFKLSSLALMAISIVLGVLHFI